MFLDKQTMLSSTCWHAIDSPSNSEVPIVSDKCHSRAHCRDQQQEKRPDFQESSGRVLQRKSRDESSARESATLTVAAEMVSRANVATQKVAPRMDGQKILDKSCKKVLKAIKYLQYLSIMLFVSDKRKRTLHLFLSACQEAQLPLAWGKPQVIEFLLLLDKLHLSAGVLKSHWMYVKQISTMMNHCISGIEKNLYDVVIACCKPINDNKCPVSRELLAELCAAAPVVFQMYNAKLARAMFICAFAGFMRCCEFTESSGNRPNHNLLDHSVNITQDHLGISFWSDKCSYNDLLVKHRLVSWEFLQQELLKWWSIT